jgi:hypothetical protein
VEARINAETKNVRKKKHKKTKKKAKRKTSSSSVSEKLCVVVFNN